MSGHNPCTCDGTRKERMKNWRVSRRNYNNSYFEHPKGADHYSDYSSIVCLGDGGEGRQGNGCLMVTRSKANYVSELPDLV